MIGYTDNVILPLAVVPQNRAKPVTLRLKLDYAVARSCACRPKARPNWSSPAAPPAGPRAGRSRSAGAEEARARRRLTARGQVGSPRGGGDATRVIVDVAAPAGERVALFAEGPTPDWARRCRRRSRAPSGTQRFAFDLDGAPAGARYEGAPITLTARAGNAAIEVVIRLD